MNNDGDESPPISRYCCPHDQRALFTGHPLTVGMCDALVKRVLEPRGTKCLPHHRAVRDSLIRRKWSESLLNSSPLESCRLQLSASGTLLRPLWLF